jgi:hypothetical protein
MYTYFSYRWVPEVPVGVSLDPLSPQYGIYEELGLKEVFICTLTYTYICVYIYVYILMYTHKYTYVCI